MADDQVQKPANERADVIRRVSPRGMLGGEFWTRMLRGWQAFIGYDPTIGTETPLTALGFDGQTYGSLLLADFTQAPYRKNGQSFTVTAASAAPGAFNNALLFQNLSDSRRPLVIVVDWFEAWGGATDLNYGLCGTNAVTSQTGHMQESQPTNLVGTAIALASGIPKSPMGTVTAPAIATVAGDGGAAPSADILGRTVIQVAVTNRVPFGDLLIWPQQCLFLQELTQNLALTVTVHGRVVDLGQPGAPYT